MTLIPRRRRQTFLQGAYRYARDEGGTIAE
jgi:hypothetical protein